MIEFGKNTTAHTTNLSSMNTDKTYTGSVSYNGLNDSFLTEMGHIPVLNSIADDYENLDSDYVSEVIRLLSTFAEDKDSDANFDACRIALDNKVKPDEIYLMETMFENRLESLSKHGIKIFEIDGGLDIRGEKSEKYLSHEEREKLEDHLVDSYNDNGDEFDVSGVGFDPSTSKHGYNITTSGAKLEADTIQASDKEVTMKVCSRHGGTYSLVTEHDY